MSTWRKASTTRFACTSARSARFTCLTAADEKRLARQMEERDYIQRLEAAIHEKTQRRAAAAQVLVELLNDLETLAKFRKAVGIELGLKKLSLWS